MTAHANMKINELFSFISAQVESHEDRQSLYKTVREILKFRKELDIRNNVTEMLDNYTKVFTHFVENYKAAESDMHVKNLDTIHDLYFMYSESDDEDYVQETEPDSEDDEELEKEENVCDNKSQEDDRINLVVQLDTNDLERRNKREHTKTRWWLSGLYMLQIAQITLTGYMFLDRAFS